MSGSWKADWLLLPARRLASDKGPRTRPVALAFHHYQWVRNLAFGIILSAPDVSPPLLTAAMPTHSTLRLHVDTLLSGIRKEKQTNIGPDRQIIRHREPTEVNHSCP